ncbi:MAG TPA: hypothetical protein VHR66_28615 [Gemmataceae bacterium]|jgi:hypothetical protein|nr:hypothetical protein [Gemmataceae bacterium]
MRLARLLLIGLMPIALAGCLHEADRPAWMKRLPLLRSTPDSESATLEYVLIERPVGGDEINRKVWDRIDEQIVPFETRTVLDDAGLRVGIASESTPGPLRKLIDDPRTGRGHRFRTFSLDRPAPLLVSGALPHAEFNLPGTDGRPTKFGRDQTALGFEITIRDAPDGKVLVKLVPHAKFREPGQIIPAMTGEREQGTESFPAAGFEIALSDSEFLVIGTDSFRASTFGHSALIGAQDERRVQRLLVLRAGRGNVEPDGQRPLPDKVGQATTPPLASQATAARGVSP